MQLTRAAHLVLMAVVLIAISHTTYAFSLEELSAAYESLGVSEGLRGSVHYDVRYTIDPTRLIGAERAYAVDDLIVFRLGPDTRKPFNDMNMLRDIARDILDTLRSNGEIAGYPDTVYLGKIPITGTAGDYNEVVLIVPRVSTYTRLSDVVTYVESTGYADIQVITPYGDFSGRYVLGKNMFVDDPTSPSNIFFVPENGMYVISIFPSFSEVHPENLREYCLWNNTTDVIQCSGNTGNTAPISRYLLTQIIYINKDQYPDLYRAYMEGTDPFISLAMIGPYLIEYKSLMSDFFMRPIDMPYYTIVPDVNSVRIVDRGVLDYHVGFTVNYFAMVWHDSLCKRDILAKYCLGADPYLTVSHDVNYDWDVAYVLYARKSAPQEENVEEQHIQDPRVSVKVVRKTVGPEQNAVVRVDFLNTDEHETMLVYLRAEGVGAGVYGDAEYNRVVPPRRSFSWPFFIEYATAKDPLVRIHVVAIGLNTMSYRFERELNVPLDAYYGLVDSFCLDENRLAKVKDGVVYQVVDCSAVGKKCYENTSTYADCRVNKPYGPEGVIDEIYAKNFRKQDPKAEMLLFGVGGLGTTIVGVLDMAIAKGSLAQALKSATFWQALLGSLAAIGVSYYLYKSMPDDCRAKPFVAVLAPIAGLLGGATGLLALSGIGFLLCLFGGKRMKY